MNSDAPSHAWRWVALAIVCAMAVVPLGVIAYWLFDWSPPVRIQHPEIIRTAGIGGTERSEFRAGETILVWRGACVDRRVTVSGRRWLADTEIVLLLDAAEVDEAIHVGQCESRWVWLDLPKTLGTGRWEYHAERTYVLNPLRSVTIRWPAVPFEIVPPAPSQRVEQLEHKVDKLEKKIGRVVPPVKPGPQGPPGVQGQPGPPGPPGPPPKKRWWE